MPQVPNYNPTPNVSPTEEGAPSVHVDTPVAAFGGATAEATSKLGADAQQASNELWNRAMALQGLANENEKTQAQLEFQKQSGDITGKYLSTEGQDAVNGLKPYVGQLQTLRQGIRDKLSNPMVRSQFDAETVSFTGALTRYADRHAAEQFKAFNVSTAKAGIEQAKITMMKNYNNPELVAQGVQEIKRKASQIAAIHGLPQQVADVTAEQNIAEANYRMASARAVHDPFGAMRDFKKDPSVYGQYAPQTDIMLQQHETTYGSRQLVNGLTSGSYLQRLASIEGSSKNPNSTANGPYQFLDGTWKTLRETHPELGLPANKLQASPKQLSAAINTFTSDNEAALVKAGIKPNGQNLYLAHFLGSGGAISFVQKMQENPNASAVSIAGEAAAKANHNLFYNQDGTPKTAQDFYMGLTQRFAGTEFTASTTGEQLEDTIKAGVQLANWMDPNNTALADRVREGILTKYHQVRGGYLQAQQQSQNQLITFALQGGTMDQMLHNPVYAEMYNSLEGGRQKVVSQAFDYVKTRDYKNNQDNYLMLQGLAKTDQEKFLNTDLIKFGLDRDHFLKLETEKAQILHGQQNNSDLNYVLHDPTIAALVKAQGFDPNDTPKQHFLGALDEWLKDYRAMNGKAPTKDEYQSKVSDLLTTSGGFYGFFGTPKFEQEFGKVGEHKAARERIYANQAEALAQENFASQFTPLYQKHYGTPPGPAAIKAAYEYAKKNPNWAQELH